MGIDQMLDVCLLGCGGMMPLPNRWLSALMIRYNGKIIMIDCGEGTQIPMKLTGWGFKSVNTILVTHFHADHISGLPGLLLTLGNSSKDDMLEIYGPLGMQKVYNGLTVICPELPYNTLVSEIPYSEISNFAINGLSVTSVPVEHTMPCLAYIIELKRMGKFDLERAKEQNIPMQYWKHLQAGETITDGEKTYTPEMVLGKERKGLKLAYCTDTRPTNLILDMIKDADLLICEGNYGDNEKLSKAVEKKHMLFSEAATLAKEANVKELILTHFSPSIDNPSEYLEQTRKIFSNTYLGKNLLKRKLLFDQE
jgi:ribonuclease Z